MSRISNDDIIRIAETTDYDDEGSVKKLGDALGALRSENPDDLDRYKEFFLYLARSSLEDFFEQHGDRFFSLLLANDYEVFTREIEWDNGTENAVHIAIGRDKHYFVDCLLRASNEPKKIATILESVQGNSGKNCLHLATTNIAPYAVDMIAKCNRKTILAKDHNWNTPLHIAMASRPERGQSPTLNRPRPTDPDIRHAKANTPKMRSVPADGKGESKSIDNRGNNEAKYFKPELMYREIQRHILKDSMTVEDKSAFMTELLTAVNKRGQSPYQTLMARLEDGKSKARPQASHAATGVSSQKDTPLHEKMKADIFFYLTDLVDVQKALYGIEGPDKELFLDMSDFNNPSHDFKGFVARLTAGLQYDAEGIPKLKEASVKFETTLFYLRLPNFNNFTETPGAEVRRLFSWLSAQGVNTLKSVSIPDSITAPMCDVLVDEAIIQPFWIEKFDWQKLDINLEIMTNSKNSKYLTELRLYSSGNWSVLYHWINSDGLERLKKLQKVSITIVRLNPQNDHKAQVSYQKKISRYEAEIRTKLEAIQKQRPGFKFEIDTKGKWNFPVPRHDAIGAPVVPSLKLGEQLQNCHSFLKQLLWQPTNVFIPEDLKQAYVAIKRRLDKYAKEPQGNQPDRRIKVAVIDNGADRVGHKVSEVIAKGVSYVDGGSDNDDRTLPWWMPTDPHGTQMASVINDANPFCRLYIARVGKGRKDILPDNAAKAVTWAIEQNVDIISISWVIHKDYGKLAKAIKSAVDDPDRRPILVFCSTADEGIYSGKVYPAHYNDVVRVAATDKYGRLKPESDSGVNILVPGQDIAADGPSYIEKYATGVVSGSSVATATAAGIASLALLLLKIFNDEKDHDKELRRFYTWTSMKEVFNKMHDKLNNEVTGIELSDLFPSSKGPDGKSNNEQSRKLNEVWQIKNFEEKKGNS